MVITMLISQQAMGPVATLDIVVGKKDGSVSSVTVLKDGVSHSPSLVNKIERSERINFSFQIFFVGLKKNIFFIKNYWQIENIVAASGSLLPWSGKIQANTGNTSLSPSVASSRKSLDHGERQQRETTLAKDLARFYDAPVSLEYAREYQIKNNVRDDELTPKDYYYLLLGQYDQTSKLIDSSANRGLVIADTNSLVTKGYYDYYMEVEGQDTSMTDTFDNLFVSILSKEKWDLILFVQPIGSYVNDGFRDMTMADEEIPHQLFKLPGPIAPAIPRKHSDYFPSHQTTSATTKKPRRWSMLSTKPTKEQLMKNYLKNSQL